jgi:hypothetical protein
MRVIRITIVPHTTRDIFVAFRIGIAAPAPVSSAAVPAVVRFQGRAWQRDAAAVARGPVEIRAFL